jgi:DNA-binding MurR/RpiR family transcriptional regulator
VSNGVALGAPCSAVPTLVMLVVLAWMNQVASDGKVSDDNLPPPLEESLPEGITVRLRSIRDDLSPVSQKIVDFILDNPRRVIGMSVSDVAAELGVSVGSVVRICQQIGMKGFQEMKLSLSQEVVAPSQFIHEDVAPTDPVEQIIAKVIQSDIAALIDTLKVLDAAQIKRAVQLILNAERVEFYGIGSSAPVATDIYYRMLRIGINCVVSTDSHMQAVSASMTNPRIVVLTISHSGSTRETVDATRIAKQRGAKVICVTNYGKSPIQEYADVVLYTAAQETRFRTEAMTSRVAQLSVIDALCVCVAIARFDESVENINRTANILSSKRY